MTSWFNGNDENVSVQTRYRDEIRKARCDAIGKYAPKTTLNSNRELFHTHWPSTDNPTYPRYPFNLYPESKKPCRNTHPDLLYLQAMEHSLENLPPSNMHGLTNHYNVIPMNHEQYPYHIPVTFDIGTFWLMNDKGHNGVPKSPSFPNDSSSSAQVPLPDL